MERSGSSSRSEAERWLNIAEKLLAARDLHGTRTFAIRARESDQRLEAADQILAVVDTLLAAECRINQHLYDCYAILQLARLTQNMDIIATQYRKLALLLNPEQNKLAFADQAFRLVSDAWSVLSNPSKKALYDNEVRLSQFGQPQQPQRDYSQTPPLRKSPRTKKDGKGMLEEERPSLNNAPKPTLPTHPSRPAVPEPTQPSRPSVPEPALPSRPSVPAPTQPSRPAVPEPTQQGRPAEPEPTRPNLDNTPKRAQPIRQSRPDELEPDNFWTACPYCYVLYEYPRVYEECTLRCQNCQRAFHAVMIPSPPATEKDTYFCCWGFFPLGFSGNAKNTGGFSGWTPVSPMFACPSQGNEKGKSKHADKRPAPMVYYDDEDVYTEISDPSDDDFGSDDEWNSAKEKKKAKSARGKGTPSKYAKRTPSERINKGNRNVDGQVNVDNGNGNLGGGGSVVQEVVAGSSNPSKSSNSAKRQMGRGAKELGKLDLNVEFSNEVEEPGFAVNAGNRAGNGEEDNIEGIGFFEGLDEFLSSLPILNVVADDKVKAT